MVGHGAVGGGKAGLAGACLCVTAAPSSVPFTSDAQPCLEEGEVLPCGLYGMAGSVSAAQRRGKNAFPAFGDGSEQSWSSKGVACAELS